MVSAGRDQTYPNQDRPEGRNIASFKRQLTDKYSAEKVNSTNKRMDGGHRAGSRVDSQDVKTRLSFPSDFSQAALAKRNQKEVSPPIPIRRSGTMRSSQEKNRKRNPYH